MVTLLPDEQDELLVSLEDLHSLQDAHLPGADLAQRPLREAQVISLTMADPVTWPSILVTRTQEHGLLVIDGYHRREAGKRCHLAEIRVTVRTFTSEAAVIEAAFEANLHHGVPASATTRSDYAFWLFTTYPDLKQNEIARRVGLKPSTVNTAIKRRVQQRRAAEQTSVWRRKEDLEHEARKHQDEEELRRLIRGHLRSARRLYDRLQRMDPGPRYWTLEKAIDEGDKVMLFRLLQYLEQYLKDSLPPDLVKSLKPATTTRTRRTTASSNPSVETPSTQQDD